DYSVQVGGPYFLTAGPFDFSGYTGMSLHFQRWLNTDLQPYVYDTIEVSSDGTNWDAVWDNGTSEIADHVWVPVSYDIAAWSDNRTNVYVRWGYRVASQFAFPYSGWNIDDIGFLGTPLQQLTLTVPTTVNVGAGTLTGTVTAHPVPTNALTVALTSSDPSVLTVPASVTILAGHSNAVSGLTVADQLTGRAAQTIEIRAAALNYVADSSPIAVFDNAGLTLHLSLPATAIEGEGTVEGIVSIRDVQTYSLEVQLYSSDLTAIQVPASVFIPVGQTSAVFLASVVDDNLIDGPQLAQITAHLADWIDANASIVVLDDENLNLSLTVPGSAWENSGVLTNAGSVSISSTLMTNLVVWLTSSVPAKVSVPAFVTIPVGALSNSFNLFLLDNSISDGDQLVSIQASASGFSNSIATMFVQDDESPLVPTNPTPTDLATNVDLASGLMWQSGSIP